MSDMNDIIEILQFTINMSYERGKTCKFRKSIGNTDKSMDDMLAEYIANFTSCSLIPDEIIKKVTEEAFITGYNIDRELIRETMISGYDNNKNVDHILKNAINEINKLKNTNIEGNK